MPTAKGDIKDLVEKSIFIIRAAKAEFRRPAILWSGGKDSTALLHLAQHAFFGAVPFPAIHIDNGLDFPETYQYRDQMARQLRLELIVARSVVKPGKLEGASCCGQNKTEALKQVLAERGFDAIFVAIRRDEHGMRSLERYVSPRDRQFRWNVYRPSDGPYGAALQDAEFVEWGVVPADFGADTSHVRIHPMLHWREIDVWSYLKQASIPIHPLYFARDGKRYRSLGCRNCTVAMASAAKDIDGIIGELAQAKTDERAGRSMDSSQQHAMQRLRALGYM